MKAKNNIKKLYNKYEKKFNNSFFTSKEDLLNFCIINLCYLRDNLLCGIIKGSKEDDLLNLTNILNQYQYFNTLADETVLTKSVIQTENNFSNIEKEKIKSDLAQTKFWYYLKCYFGGALK